MAMAGIDALAKAIVLLFLCNCSLFTFQFLVELFLQHFAGRCRQVVILRNMLSSTFTTEELLHLLTV